MKEKIAFIGVGIMGRGIVNNLKKLTYPISLYTRNKEKIKDLKDELTTIANSPEEAIQDAKFTILCLTEDKVVKNFLNESRFFELGKGYLLDFGTTSYQLTQEIFEKSKQREIHFLDSPMTGSKLAARDGQILFMIGANSQEDIEACRFIWEKVGRKIIHCGKVGNGQLTKLALNLVQAGILQMYMEGLMLARKSGIDSEIYWEVISNSAAKSGISDFKGKCIQERDFSTHFSLKNMNKDLNHALRLAMELHASLPLSGVLKSIFDSGMSKGLGELDFVSLLQVNEERNDLPNER